MNTVSLCLALHNHQPVGNFNHVIEQAYQDSYLPFLEVLEPYEHIRISLHTSGPLAIWLSENHPEYFERVKALVAAGRIEILGGPFYEPILTMLPSRDRIGQINRYTDWLQQRFDCDVNGMWTPERVWESQLVRDIGQTSIDYTILDDFHFRSAGVPQDKLTSYFSTEDDGSTLSVFPGNERLRYLIPFAPVGDFLDFAQQTANKNPGSILVFGDDGEKFGTWPDTKKHVYEDGWLREFFDALTENRDWLQTSTLTGVTHTHAPVRSVYIPDCSYREMTEWSLPIEQQQELEQLKHSEAFETNRELISQFIKGGFWRNFRVKYSETNEMYSRMLEISNRLEAARTNCADPELLPQAEDHLYRGQCNCPYWHGAFGGVYLPHLRNATYRELIAADNLLERALGKTGRWVDVVVDDFNSDLYPEAKIANDRLAVYLAPSKGGNIYELDVRQIQHNLLATMQRRPEVYHETIRQGVDQSQEDGGSIHDRVVFKQTDLDQHLQYDRFARKSLVDHFFDNDTEIDAVAGGEAEERADFTELPFTAKMRRSSDKAQLQLHRAGNIWGVPVRLTKAVTISAGSSNIEVVFLFEDLPPGRPFHFASEWNFAGMPAGADDRFFYDETLNRQSDLGQRQDLNDTSFIGLIDQWLGIDVQLSFSKSANLWAFPIQTVSQSESGFELVHQSVCVMPHWIIQGDEKGQWAVSIDINLACRHEPKMPTKQSESTLSAFATIAE